MSEKIGYRRTKMSNPYGIKFEDNESLESQVLKLAKCIQKNYPDSIKNGGAIEIALQIIYDQDVELGSMEWKMVKLRKEIETLKKDLEQRRQIGKRR